MKYSELHRKIRRAGWYKVRQDGTSHVIYAHKDFDYTINVPNHGAREVGKGLLKETMKRAGLKK